jgi:hypothetical protein
MATAPTPAKFRLTLGWRSYLVTAADAVTVMNILGAAECVDSVDISDQRYFRPVKRESMTLDVADAPLLTAEEVQRLQKIEEEERAAEAAQEGAAA